MRSNIQDEGDEDYAASTAGFVEGICSEPALHQHDGDHGCHEGKLMCRKVTQENLIDISLLFRENLQNGIDRLRNAAYTKSYQNNLI